MEGNPKKSPKLGHPPDSSDAKYVSGLSTILVATIEEAKDRISQIEYIFCSQLFPNFQSQFQSFQKIYAEAREASEFAYKEKERELLHQITKIQSENQKVLEENQSLKFEKEKLLNSENQSHNRLHKLEEDLRQKNLEVNQGNESLKNLQKLLESKASLIHTYENTIKELEEKDNLLLKKQKNLEVEIEDLRLHLMKKSKEVDEIMELQNELLHINQSKASLLVQKEMQLKAYEEKVSGLTSKVENMEKTVDELQSAVRDKTEEVEKRNKMQENLLQKIEFQASKIINYELQLNKCKEENTQLATEIDNWENRVHELQKVLNEKNNELEDGRKVQDQLLKETCSLSTGRMKRGQDLDEYEKERKLLWEKQRGLEDKVEKLQKSLYARSKECSEGMELHGKLLKQIEAKDSEIQFEKGKILELICKYKKLKSQYLYMCTKLGHTPETALPHNKKENASETIRDDQNPVAFCEIENKASTAVGVSSEVTKTEGDHDMLEDNKGVVVAPRSGPVPPSTSDISIVPNCPSSIKTCPSAGAKRSISCWRDTRSHQSRAGADPHDDFLDTPVENIRGDSGKVMKEESHDLGKLDPKKTAYDTSDDETQDMNVDPGPEKKQMPPPKPGPSNFKYVGPVRKKAEREKLKGIECKQCKKFYDAVLPEAGKNSDGSKQNIRCEHHDGVSRHRYRYNPPSTPEGFWNIGFESEMQVTWPGDSKIWRHEHAFGLKTDIDLCSNLFSVLSCILT